MSNETEMAFEERAVQIKSLADVDLELRFGRSVKNMAVCALDACLCYMEMKRRGTIDPDIRPPVEAYCSRIASGTVSAGAWYRFGGYPLLLSKVVTLSMPEQELLAVGERVAMKVTKGDPKRWYTLDHVLMDPLNMTDKQVRRVFADGRIRSVSEQAAMSEQDNENEDAGKLVKYRVGEELNQQACQAASDQGLTLKEYAKQCLERCAEADLKARRRKK